MRYVLFVFFVEVIDTRTILVFRQDVVAGCAVGIRDLRTFTVWQVEHITSTQCRQAFRYVKSAVVHDRWAYSPRQRAYRRSGTVRRYHGTP